MSDKKLQASIAPLQWSCDAAQGKMTKLDWVDGTISPYATSFRVQDTKAGKKYRHRPYAAYLPKVMQEASKMAQQNGEPTVLEGLLLAFAKVEWLLQTRRFYWSPMSPVPSLLAILVESMGVDVELHRNRPDVLSRLVARMPTWNPSRGTVQGAKDLLVETIEDEVPVRTAQVPKDKPIPIDPDITQEIFLCRDGEWWDRRLTTVQNPVEEQVATPVQMRVSSGFVQFQNPENPMPLHHEDVLVGWKLADKFPTNLLRLLPAWISIRVVVLSKDK